MQTALNSETPQTSKSRPTVAPRCSHLSPAGRRCSQPVCSSHPSLCFTHKPKLLSPEEAILQELTEAAAKLATPEDVNRVLCKIFQALVQDLISLKKAGTLCYIVQNILRAQRDAVFHQKFAHELELQEEERNPPRICGPWADDIDRRRTDSDSAQALAKTAESSNTPASEAAKVSAAADGVLANEAVPKRNSPVLISEQSPISASNPAFEPQNAPKTPISTTQLNSSPTQSSGRNSNSNPANAKSPKSKTAKPTPPPLPDLNHFHPWDPTLPQGRQDPARNLPPPAETPSPTFHSIARAAMRRYRAFLP